MVPTLVSLSTANIVVTDVLFSPIHMLAGMVVRDMRRNLYDRNFFYHLSDWYCIRI
jgi:hypothetical protein